MTSPAHPSPAWSLKFSVRTVHYYSILKFNPHKEPQKFISLPKARFEAKSVSNSDIISTADINFLSCNATGLRYDIKLFNISTLSWAQRLKKVFDLSFKMVQFEASDPPLNCCKLSQSFVLYQHFWKSCINSSSVIAIQIA